MSKFIPSEGGMQDLRKMRERAGMSRLQLAEALGYHPRQIQRWEAMESPLKPAIRNQILQILGGTPRQPAATTFRYIDLFAGIGGLRIPFDEIGGNCVFTSEWDKYANMTYRANFGADHDIAGDITKIRAEEIPPHDVLLAGFPCQPFSLAGVSKKNALGRPHGFEDLTQGTLFFDVARIIECHRPRAFLLENVKNLLSHDGGRTFNTIRHVLTAELGYSITWRVIDARSFVPQHRERVIIVGFRDPVPTTLEELELPGIESGPVLSSILHPEDGTEVPEDPFTDSEGVVNQKYVLTDKLWEYLQNYAEKHRLKGNGFGFGLVGPDDVARTLSARYYKDGSEILIKRNGNPRRLTPRECARLMGFDTAGGRRFEIPVSDTQAYKQFGNSVAVPMIRAVAQHLRPYLSSDEVASQLALPLSFAHA
jgi:DNA (cytosine-5)-methyltransferase 1